MKETLVAVNWDYSALAANYDDRADYDSRLITEVFRSHCLPKSSRVLDLGAGTGKLTKELVKQGVNTIASEPNDAMREIGARNVSLESCKWINSPGESIALGDASIDSVWFGSSFNVMQHAVLFKELKRVMTDNAWLTCLWNHRDLNDKVQKQVESVITSQIPNYEYGSRRQDPTEILMKTGMFDKVHHFHSGFKVVIPVATYVNAWKSHATLQRQCRSGRQFQQIVKSIENLLKSEASITVPYSTTLWTTKRSARKQ